MIIFPIPRDVEVSVLVNETTRIRHLNGVTYMTFFTENAWRTIQVDDIPFDDLLNLFLYRQSSEKLMNTVIQTIQFPSDSVMRAFTHFFLPEHREQLRRFNLLI